MANHCLWVECLGCDREVDMRVHWNVCPHCGDEIGYVVETEDLLVGHEYLKSNGTTEYYLGSCDVNMRFGDSLTSKKGVFVTIASIKHNLASNLDDLLGGDTFLYEPNLSSKKPRYLKATGRSVEIPYEKFLSLSEECWIKIEFNG